MSSLERTINKGLSSLIRIHSHHINSVSLLCEEVCLRVRRKGQVKEPQVNKKEVCSAIYNRRKYVHTCEARASSYVLSLARKEFDLGAIWRVDLLEEKWQGERRFRRARRALNLSRVRRNMSQLGLHYSPRLSSWKGLIWGLKSSVVHLEGSSKYSEARKRLQEQVAHSHVRKQGHL